MGAKPWVPRDTEGFKKAIQDNTKCIFGELVGNPGNELMNMPEIVKIAHNAGIPVIIDSTYQTPYLFKPLEHGADVVVQSATVFCMQLHHATTVFISPPGVTTTHVHMACTDAPCVYARLRGTK